MNMITIVDRNDPVDIERVYIFSKLEHPPNFRYFRTRVFQEAIKSHLVTLLYTSNDDRDVGYAHIDMDTTSGRAYFGICILPEYQSQGIGKLLIEAALRLHTGRLYLTVDKDNTKAINLYKKYNFICIENTATYDIWSLDTETYL